MIRLDNVRKVYPTRFGEKLVLDGVGFELTMGQRLGVLGRNGAGKSTMVRLISGAERPSAGTIERHMSVSWPLAFGGAFQVMLTGQDNVRFISRIYGQDFERNLDFVEDFAELGPYLREPVRTYSSGMRARLAFAISMIIDFDCFLIDEIASVGDARFHHKCNYELFEKRSDRAMIIISHDAAYVRDHCNRFAVLHEGRLTHYDDFDVAYDFYSDVIGMSEPAALLPARFTNRAAALQTLYRIAVADERFRVHVQQGDWARDRGDWADAEAEYAAALALHPYERTYWVQYGHASREQGKFALAELGYRTAAAFGQPLRDLRPFLDAAMVGQGASAEQCPVPTLQPGATALQPPGYPDVQALVRLVWGEQAIGPDEALALVRSNQTLDSLASALIADQRAAAARRSRASNPGNRDADARWLAQLCFITMPRFDYSDEAGLPAYFGDHSDVLGKLIYANGFEDWPETRQALSTLLETHNVAD